VTRPPRPTAALERLGRLTGIGHGQVGVDLIAVLGYIDALEHEVSRADRLTTAVGEAIDRVDPDDPAALIELLHAWQAVLDARCDTPPAVERRPSPRPRDTATPTGGTS
jgi:hypothetical protein